MANFWRLVYISFILFSHSPASSSSVWHWSANDNSLYSPCWLYHCFPTYISALMVASASSPSVDVQLQQHIGCTATVNMALIWLQLLCLASQKGALRARLTPSANRVFCGTLHTSGWISSHQLFLMRDAMLLSSPLPVAKCEVLLWERNKHTYATSPLCIVMQFK